MVTDVFFRKVRSHVIAAERCNSTVYYKGQWWESSRWYLAYRGLHLLLIAGALLISLLGRDDGLSGRWPIFLTNWALILYLTQAALAFHLVKAATSAERSGTLIKMPSKLLELYGCLHSTAVVIALGVTVIYWSFIYNPEIHQLDFVNLTVHGGNSVIMVIDLFLVSHPVKLVNILWAPFFTFIYSIFNIIYFLCGGTDRKGNHYVYKVLDWTSPINATLFILGGMFLLVILHIIIWFLTVLRRHIGIKMKAKTCETIPHQDPSSGLPLA